MWAICGQDFPTVDPLNPPYTVEGPQVHSLIPSERSLPLPHPLSSPALIESHGSINATYNPLTNLVTYRFNRFQNRYTDSKESYH